MVGFGLGEYCIGVVCGVVLMCMFVYVVMLLCMIVFLFL